METESERESRGNPKNYKATSTMTTMMSVKGKIYKSCAFNSWLNRAVFPFFTQRGTIGLFEPRKERKMLGKKIISQAVTMRTSFFLFPEFYG